MGLSKGEQERHDKFGIKKADLIDGAYYAGHCRNASIARWNASKNEFFYIRSKFGSEFVESLPCPEDAIDGLDYFQPEGHIPANPFVIDFE